VDLGLIGTLPKADFPGYQQVWQRLDWVICGGESGAHARPMHPEWARGLREQCAKAHVPFLFKSWGAVRPMSTLDGEQILPFGRYVLPGECKAFPRGFGFIRNCRPEDRRLDGLTHDAYPEVDHA
jgi:hypothetical protein